MVDRIENVNRFVQVMQDSQSLFEQEMADFTESKTAVNDSVAALGNSINLSFLKKLGTVTSAGLGQYRKTIERDIKDILKQIVDQVKKDIDGMQFIHDYEHSFLVIVYGMVKSGKSSLGNFVSGSDIYGKGTVFDEMPREKIKRGVESGLNTEGTALLEGDAANQEYTFAVGASETTSKIQVLQTGALSWMDTPGIGSTNEANQNLADEYVKYADLILFTTHSGSAGRIQEFRKLTEFLKQGKRIVLLITMSDDFEESEDEEGNLTSIRIPKSEKDRRDVENYLWEELRKIPGVTPAQLEKQVTLLTISKALAVDAFEQQSDLLYEQSNLNKLLDILVQITETEAAQLKLRTPHLRINAILDVILNGDTSLTFMRTRLEQVLADLEKDEEKLKELQEDVKSEIKDKVQIKIDSMLSEMLAEINNSRSKSSSQNVSGKILEMFSGDAQAKLKSIRGEEIAERMMEIIRKTVETVCKEKLSQYLNSATKSITSHLTKGKFQLMDMHMKTDSVTYLEEVVHNKYRSPRGIWEWIEEKIFRIDHYEIKHSTETRTKTIDVGINDSEIRVAIGEQLEAYFEDEITPMFVLIRKEYFEPLRSLIAELLKYIEEAEMALEAVRVKNQQGYSA